MAAWCRAERLGRERRSRCQLLPVVPAKARGFAPADGTLPPPGSRLPRDDRQQGAANPRRSSRRSGLPQRLSARLPFFYGWVVLACLCCVGFARQGAATATLSIFVEPLTREFGWSRTALSGAVSLGWRAGGVVVAADRPAGRPSRLAPDPVSCGVRHRRCDLLLSLTNSLLVFYLLFCVARMNWAGAFELGIYGALNNWFVARRAFATSVATVAQMAGLVAMPLIAQLAMRHHGWRAGWLAIGTAVLVIGFLPTWLLLVRRPEDLGLRPDRRDAGRGAAARRRGGRRRSSRALPGARRSAPRRSGYCCSTPCWSTRCKPGSACIRRPI